MSAPLDGYRVVDLTAVVSGPMATCVLADQGADVIKVEPLGVGDLTRVLGAQRGGVCSLFETINRGKRSVALNLKESRGRELLQELVRSADLFAENFRPGALDRLELSYEDLSQLKEDLIYVSISGFGPDGPYSGKRVYDSIVQAVSGIAAVQANPEIGQAELVRNLICDKVTALTAAQAMTAALLKRERTGKGGRVHLSMLDASVAFLWPDGFGNEMYLPDEEAGEVDLMPRTNNNYRPLLTRDGAVALMAVSDSDFVATCRALELHDMTEDPHFATVRSRRQHATEMTERFANALSRLDTETAVRRMEEEDAPCGRINSRDEVPLDPQVRHNGIVVEMVHPSAGAIAVARSPAVFDQQPFELRKVGPSLGQHTDDVLEELGLEPEEIVELREAGIAG